MKYYIAIDQGGSKTEALLFCETGEILAFADDRDVRKPGESYATMQGAWIKAATVNALSKAGLSITQLSGASCALNGADWDEDYPRLQNLVSTQLGLAPESIIIVNDCVGAMRGGANCGNMAVLCLGSGMNTAVRAADGREYIYGFFANAPDQGGGALGTRAWQCMIDAYNNIGEQTLMTKLTLEHYDEPDFVTLYKKFTSNKTVFRNYDFSPILMRAAKQNDKVALEILAISANRLIRYIEEGAKRLSLGNEKITLVLTGGVFKGDGYIFFDTIKSLVKEKGLPFVCCSAKYEPVAGTAMLMLDTLDIRDKAIETFCNFASKFNMERLK